MKRRNQFKLDKMVRFLFWGGWVPLNTLKSLFRVMQCVQLRSNSLCVVLNCAEFQIHMDYAAKKRMEKTKKPQNEGYGEAGRISVFVAFVSQKVSFRLLMLC